MNINRTISIFILLTCFLLGACYFTNVLVYVFLAMILSIIGSPLMRLLDKISIKKRKIPQSIAAMITLIVLVGAIGAILFSIIPMIFNEFQILAAIDPTMFQTEIDSWLSKITVALQNWGLLIDTTLSDLIASSYNSFMEDLKIVNFASNLFSFVGDLFIGAFSVIFLSFFALKDRRIFFKVVRKYIPLSFRENYDHILHNTKSQLVRYFSGVFAEMIVVGLAEGLLCYLLGVPNPALIGLIGGALNIIPYAGPAIATVVSVIISITGLLPSGVETAELTIVTIKVVSAILFVKIIDDFIIQPVLYGKRVNAHPIEIFIVILVAGYVGGIFAMILAVPAYSFVRIIVKEFFGEYFYETQKREMTVIEAQEVQDNDEVTDANE